MATRFTFRRATETEKSKAIKIFAEPGSKLANVFGGGWIYLMVSTQQVGG